MSTKCPSGSTAPGIARRGVHLDLKGLPPTPDRLLSLVLVFNAAGYNCILVEWEDTFPWTVDPRFRCETAYTADVIRQFHAEAGRLGMEVIPLVQCLGHMETPLSLPAYAHMREIAHMPDVMNVLAPGARDLVRRMVDDVLSLTPGARYLHLGGDEAWSFGLHPDTAAYVAEHGKGALYLQHIEPILDSLNARGVRPILWHDMMRGWDATALQRIAGKADLMVWGYNGVPAPTDTHHGSGVMERFASQGIALWGATAYKGCDGMDSDRPVPAERGENALAWVDLAKRFSMQGVVATAWSRWTTLYFQTDPIDGALDAAFLVGAILTTGKAPDGGTDACREMLASIGELQRFDACCMALNDLSRHREANWKAIRLLRQLAITSTQDVRKRPATALRHWYGVLRAGIRQIEAAGAAVREAFDGLVDPVWIQRYCDERILPFRQEADAVEPVVRETDPDGYVAIQEGRA